MSIQLTAVFRQVLVLAANRLLAEEELAGSRVIREPFLLSA